MKHSFFPILFLTFIFSAQADVSRPSVHVLGPDTMGHPEYPNSGTVGRQRTNDVTGEDTSSAVYHSSTQSPIIPPGAEASQAQEEGADSEGSIEVGPYKDGEYQHWTRPVDR